MKAKAFIFMGTGKRDKAVTNIKTKPKTTGIGGTNQK